AVAGCCLFQALAELGEAQVDSRLPLAQHVQQRAHLRQCQRGGQGGLREVEQVEAQAHGHVSHRALRWAASFRGRNLIWGTQETCLPIGDNGVFVATHTVHAMQFADRLNNVETSAIRELFKLLGKPGIISFAGGFPDSAMFDVDGIRAASNAALAEEPGAALQYGATEGYQPLREQLSAFMASKGAQVAPEELIVTTGSQQALDLLGKTLVGPGDKVIVEGPTFLATIQCFRLYGAELVSAPIDGDGVQTDELEKLIAEHKPKFVYLIPTFGNPSGAMLSAERRKAVLEMA